MSKRARARTPPRWALLILSLVGAACAREVGPAPGTCLALPRAPSRDLVAWERLYPALRIPGGVDLVLGPEGQRWYVVTQEGKIYTFAVDDPLAAPALFADLGPRLALGAEAGLLAMAFHPDFAATREVFLSYTGPGGPVFTSRIGRFLSDDAGLTLDLDSEAEVFALAQPYSNHNGGDLAFGPDGALYFSLGDGGSAGDPQDRAQDIGSLFGKILRLDVDGGDPYAIPPDNPFAAGGGAPEIYAWGLRNPWRIAFDRETGALWAGDVGQNLWEEVDLIERGGNYGWNVKEGRTCFGQDTCDEAGLRDPVAVYRNTGGASVIAGAVYRGAAAPAAAGLFLYTDFYGATLWGVAPGQEPRVLSESSERQLVAFAEDRDGEVVALSREGSLFRLRAAPPATGPALPNLLSETGCVDPADPRAAPPGALAYDVRVPFWSDGADKLRWLFLPEGAQLGVAADGDLDLPVGSVAVKTFFLADAPIETRLFVRHDADTWAGYTYAWEAGDAVLLGAGEVRDLAGQPWTFPGRADCLFCHSREAGRTLGLEGAQLEDAALAALVDAGHLAGPPTASPLPALDGDAPLELRARAFLHANCAPCHRPEGPGGRARLDLRRDAPAAEVGLCDQPPRAGDLGIADARLLAPGDPARSILSARLRSLGSTRMPPLASSRVDLAGADLIDAWIASLSSCP